MSAPVPETIRGSPGFVRVGRNASGQWWFLDAQDRPLFSIGVEAINRSGRTGGRGVPPGPYAAAVNRRHPDPAQFADAVLRRARAWRVNTLGAWTAPELFDCGLHYMETLEFRKIAPEALITLGGALLPDVFDPRWKEACDQWAEALCRPRRGSRELLGYFTDDRLGWGESQPASAHASPGFAGQASGRPTLLQICLSLEPSHPAYHAAWEFTLSPRGGGLDALARAWEVPLANKEVVRQMTRSDQPLSSPGYGADDARFTQEFATRYFEVCAGAIRRHDPNHLILGCRFGSPPGAAVLGACSPAFVDVVSAHLTAVDPSPELELYGGSGAAPVLVCGFTWASEPFLKRGSRAERGPLTTVERMLGRGRAALRAIAAHPAAVGYAWRQWADGPEDAPPFGGGLVHIDDRKAREHTELFAECNASAVRTRAGSAPESPK